MNGWQDENIKWFVVLVYAGLVSLAGISYISWRIRRYRQDRRVPRARVIKER